MSNLTDWTTEYSRSEKDIRYFIEHHLHYGWYPEVHLDQEQVTILSWLTGNTTTLTLDTPETTLKWPMAGYLLDALLWRGKRIAIVASTQREANRRYQGLLYPLDHLPTEFNPYPDLRTVQELRFPSGAHIKTYTTETKKNIQDFNPNVLLLEDSHVLDARTLVKPTTTVIILEREPALQPWS